MRAPHWLLLALGAVGLGLAWAWSRDAKVAKALTQGLAPPTSPADVRRGWKPTALTLVRPKRWGFVGCGEDRSKRQWMAPEPWQGRKAGNLSTVGGKWQAWGWPRALGTDVGLPPGFTVFPRCKGPDKVSSWMPLDYNDTVGPNDWGPDVGLADVEFLESEPYTGSSVTSVVEGCVVFGQEAFVLTTRTLNLSRVRCRGAGGQTGELRVSNSGRWMATDAQGRDLVDPTFFVVLDSGETVNVKGSNDPRGEAGVGPTKNGWTLDPAAIQGKATCPLWAPVMVHRAVQRGPRVMVGGVA